MSVKCEICGREFAKKQGLKVHARSCKEVEVDNVLPEEKEAVVDTPMAQETDTVKSEKIQRQIQKLQDTRKSTYDALTRHNIDIQIKKLMEGN